MSTIAELYGRKVCSIEGCERSPIARGWCNAHHKRWLRHGDPLAGGTAPGAPLRFLQDIALTYDGDECRIWPFGRNNDGYGVIWVDGASRIVSRVVCAEAHGDAPMPAHIAAHSCGRGHLGCVNRHHLSWKTQKGNKADTVTHGTCSQGERHGAARLSIRDVSAIRAMSVERSQRQLSAQFGVSRRTIADIQHRRTWNVMPAEKEAA